MTEAEIAYLRLCAAVWQAGVALWADRWIDLIGSMPTPETSHARALRARAAFRVVG